MDGPRVRHARQSPVQRGLSTFCRVLFFYFSFSTFYPFSAKFYKHTTMHIQSTSSRCGTFIHPSMPADRGEPKRSASDQTPTTFVPVSEEEIAPALVKPGPYPPGFQVFPCGGRNSLPLETKMFCPAQLASRLAPLGDVKIGNRKIALIDFRNIVYIAKFQDNVHGNFIQGSDWIGHFWEYSIYIQ